MIINGKILSQGLLHKIAQELKQLDFRPVLCDLLVGNDPVSLSYVKVKANTAKKVGIDFNLVQLPEQSSTGEVTAAIKEQQTNPRLCGLIVQLPLPETIDTQEVLTSIDQAVDVDVINPKSSQWFYKGRGVLIPPTAGAIWEILQNTKVNLNNKQILVIGQGELVGKPITYLIKHHGYAVTTADHSTQNLKALTIEADLIISGTGQGGLLTGDMVKPGAIVIDAGTSESGAGIVGDVDRKSVEQIAGMLSPVPGGVGPVTVAKLLENVTHVAERFKISQKS